MTIWVRLKSRQFGTAKFMADIKSVEQYKTRPIPDEMRPRVIRATINIIRSLGHHPKCSHLNTIFPPRGCSCGYSEAITYLLIQETSSLESQSHSQEKQ